MLPSKKVILSSVLLSISFLAIPSPVPANWKWCCCRDDHTADSPSARSRNNPSASTQSDATHAEEQKKELSVVPSTQLPTVKPEAVPLPVFSTSSSVSNPDQDKQPLLASSSVNSSSGSDSFFDLVALRSLSSLGLHPKSTGVLEVNEYKIQETEEGVRIVSTPTGAVILVFPNTAYVAFQPHKSSTHVPLATQQMLNKRDSILHHIPSNVRGLFTSETRDALKSSALRSLSINLNTMLLRAMRGQGIEVRTYASTDHSLKEVLIRGPEKELLQIITGTTDGTETISRTFLSNAFKALSHKAEEAGSSSEDE